MTNSTFPVYSISLSGLLSWQLHALNNEGNEGNQSLTRRYYIVEKGDPEPKFVNGVSGDAIKHIQAEHLHRICLESELALSEGGRQFNPDRIGFDIELAEQQKTPLFAEPETNLAAKTAKVLQLCTVSDLEGFMVTEKKGQTLKRESVIEFGAVVGLPSFVKTQSYFHAKFGTDNPTPYNVQISSGLYATVLNIEAFRIGYNPHTFNYAIAAGDRKKRLDALLKSVLYTYLQPNGAKRNTNLPHSDHFEGIIAVSTRRCPAPIISPLDTDYHRQIESLANTLNRINGEGTIRLFSFETMAEFAEQIQQLITLSAPWESNSAEAIE
ncbi:DevR family CRISPR-associated autoregulator [Microcoleus sp. LEGE 07076]|uniref:DevR family CRISPR-associated autoregulator n=1 Tax=Microcoleus sp. LEGE 07076 TaxID=915322 RepID=UPI001880418B|nr:DevR family CRISPR-associated autoregulator [Microcoleus sp. LEGE 07076]MBE9186299.1 DevR family CRISPR-associated autoregulator [Microcoleus sp. LEGE 07076]